MNAPKKHARRIAREDAAMRNVLSSPAPPLEHVRYLQIVDMSAEDAKKFVGRTDEPVDLGPPERPERYKPGARVWGFEVSKNEVKS